MFQSRNYWTSGWEKLTMTWFSVSIFWSLTSRTSYSSSPCCQWLKILTTKAPSMPSSPLVGLSGIFNSCFASSGFKRQSATTPCEPSPKIFITSTGLILSAFYCCNFASQVQPPSSPLILSASSLAAARQASRSSVQSLWSDSAPSDKAYLFSIMFDCISSASAGYSGIIAVSEATDSLSSSTKHCSKSYFKSIFSVEFSYVRRLAVSLSTSPSELARSSSPMKLFMTMWVGANFGDSGRGCPAASVSTESNWLVTASSCYFSIL